MTVFLEALMVAPPLVFLVWARVSPAYTAPANPTGDLS